MAPEHRISPPSWEADVVLRDGGAAHLRPIAPEDAQALQAFHMAQSPRSTYLRFFAPMPRLSARDLARFTTVDGTDRVALVVLAGDAIIGVGRYDRIDAQTAEVAFNVSDAHQGRGVGSVLLEHLAAAAREQGVVRFVAEVLPENRRMVGVFAEAGYEVTRSIEDGVISLAFAIDPTERSREVMAAREHRAEAQSLRALLQPRSVVVIGASRRPDSVGGLLLADLVAGGFTGGVHVVHPEADVLAGVPAVRRLADIGEPVDLALVAVPAAAVVDVVWQCAALGVHGLVVVSSGFAETGAGGRERQRDLVRVARVHGMRVVGPSSFGVLNSDPTVSLNASLAARVPPPGRLGLFTQSAALGVAVLGAARRRGVGVSTFVSAGNRADVSGNDCMNYWLQDSATKVAGLYLESVGNPRKFSRVARQLAREKPVIVIKSGVSTFTVPPGHAVRESRAPREALEAMLRQAGVIRVESVSQLFDVAQLLISQPLPAGERVGVVGNSDALAAMAAEAALSWGLKVTDPLTVPLEASAAECGEAIDAVFAAEGTHAVIACFTPPVTGPAPRVVVALEEASAREGKPCVACLVDSGDAFAEASGAQVEGAGVDDAAREALPVYSTPEDGVRALAAAVRYAQWRRRPAGRRVDPPGMDRVSARVLVEGFLAGRGVDDPPLRLGGADAATLLGHYGIAVWPSERVSSPEQAVKAADRLGWPIALKATERRLRHPGLGGIRLDVTDERELAAHARTMLTSPAGSGPGDGSGPALLVQSMAPSGIGVLVRTLEDPLFGPLMSFGLAGDTSVLLGDLSHRIPPLTDVDVSDLVRSLRAAPRLFGYLGTPAVDVATLEDLLARVSVLADDLPEVSASELSPVQVSTSGLAVLGAAVELAVPAARTDSGRRVLPSAGPL